LERMDDERNIKRRYATRAFPRPNRGLKPTATISASLREAPGGKLALRSRFRQLLPQARPHAHAFFVAIEAELFVGRVRIVVRQRQPQQQRVRAQVLFEIVHDRDRAALAHQRRLASRSEEHTSELQSRSDLVCRLLLEKKNR